MSDGLSSIPARGSRTVALWLTAAALAAGIAIGSISLRSDGSTVRPRLGAERGAAINLEHPAAVGVVGAESDRIPIRVLIERRAELCASEGRVPIAVMIACHHE